jgi:CheY-like chemotaxis protein
VGTTFKIYFPRVYAEPEAPAASLPLEAIPEGRETVLLVEDEQAVRAVAASMLRRQGYVVLEAPGPRQALDLAAHHAGQIDLLLTDVVMPDMNGREVANRLTALRPTLRVLYVSGYTDDAIARHGVLDAGTSFLQKPFTPTSLARKVREVLDGTASPRIHTEST